MRKIEVLKDASDNKFLELLVVAETDFLITGNTNDFVIDKINGTKIVTPAEYWDSYRPM